MRFDLPAARELLRALGPLERAGDDEKSLLAFRKQVLGALKEVGFDLSKTPAKPKKKLVWKDRCALIVSISDPDADIAVHAVPSSALPEPLWDAVGDVNGATFAGPGDLTPAQWASAVRVLAGMGDDRDPKSFYGSHVEHLLPQLKKAKVKPPTLDEVKSFWNLIGEHRLGWLDNDAKPLKLDVWISSAFVYQRAM